MNLLSKPLIQDDVVISGVAGRFPNSRNVEALERNLYNKVDMVDDLETRWKCISDEMPKRSGKISDLEKFDWKFFSIPLKQANNMDPQGRILLEHAFECLLDAGVCPQNLRGSRTGVYLGCSACDTDRYYLYDSEVKDGLGVTGAERSLLANRISFTLDLRGPSVVVDAACSSSGYALDLALKAIRNGEIDAALVAGSNLLIEPNISLQFYRLGPLSKDGTCRTFDNAAEGYCRSDAIVMIFLQKANDAKRVYAKVLHSKTSVDGFKVEGIHHPSYETQINLLEEFYMEVGVDPNVVDFVEAHGTGTKVGDKVECSSIEKVFCSHREQPLRIGSVRSNMGHTEPAAAICSIVKAILTFERNLIPPNIHFNTPRADIESLNSGNLKVVTNVDEFNGNLFAVNSFGLGGANAHSLLQIHSKEKVNFGIPNDNLPRLVLWSGRSENAVNKLLDSVIHQPLDAEYVGLLHNIQSRTQPLNIYRGYGIFTQDKYGVNDDERNNFAASCISREISLFSSSQRPVVFIYSGMGSQWNTMGADLIKIPLFEASINKCHNILLEKNLNLKEILLSNDPKMFENILNTFVGIAAIQIALTDLLKALNIKPDYMVGHSVGELGCAYADDCFTAEEMILSAYSRGKASLEAELIFGSMAAIGLGHNELNTMLIDGIEIACHNSAKNSTVSGPADKIAEFLKIMQSKDIFAKKVETSNIAYHSSYIAKMGPLLLRRLRDVIKSPKKRSLKWISSSVPYENWNMHQSQYSSAEYHTNNLLSPVLFEEALQNLPENSITIEIAPHGLLQAILKQVLLEGVHIPLTKRNHKENSIFFMEALGKIFENGIDIDISKLYPPVKFPVSRSTPMISPQILWEHSEDLFVPYHNDKEQNVLKIQLNLQDEAYKFLTGHDIDGRLLFPATGYLFLVWKLLSQQHQEKLEDFDIEFEDVKFVKPTKIPLERNMNLKVIIAEGTGRFEIIEDGNDLATGFVRSAKETQLTPIESKTSGHKLTADDFYKEMKIRSYQYKGLFKSIVSCQSDGSMAEIQWQSNWIAFLDCMLQQQIFSKDSRSSVLPTSIRKFIIKPKELFKALNNVSNETLVCHHNPKLKMLRIEGVEIQELQLSAVNRRLIRNIPILETYQFFPYCVSEIVTKPNMARVCLQIAFENLQLTKMQIIEIASTDNNESLGEEFKQAASEIPLLNVDFLQLSDIKESSLSSASLIIKSRCLENFEFMQTVATQAENIFIVSREDKSDVKFDETKLPNQFKIVAIFQCVHETNVVLHYKKVHPTPLNVIKNTNGNIEDWLPSLQEFAKSTPTLVYSQNENFSGIVGLVNCIRMEPNGSNLRCFLIDDLNAPEFDVANPFYKSQVEKGLVMNVYRNGEWGSFKYLPMDKCHESVFKYGAFVNIQRPGDLTSLNWLQSPVNIKNSKTIKVHYASLNYHDVMLASGKLKVDLLGRGRIDQQCVMGMEFSGIDSSGSQIMGMIKSGALSTHIEADEDLLWSCPENWKLSEAATVPIAYGTVYTAFFVETKIMNGKSILIHAGTGGVGIAAINVALAYGLEVFTTVSTEEKKKYLLAEFPQLKPANIGNSRDTSFEQMIMKQTNGKGVDFVLNSLSEERLLASLRCLAKGGHFLEIGKFDMANDSKIGMREFLKKITFHVILLDKIFDASCEEKLNLKKLIDKDLKKGFIKPLRTNIFKPEEIEPAFRFLASGRHMGKVMIQLRSCDDDDESLAVEISPQTYCHSSHSYIILGGLGGVGLELADFLVLRGCRKLVLSSSQGISNAYQSYRIGIWESYGVQVKVTTENIAKWDGCFQIVEQASELGPVGGIFNVAVRLSDAILENQNADSFYASLGPKLIATEHFDKISRKYCPELQYFVIFSSVTAGVGMAGVCNYGMANSGMERIIERRVKDNFPGKAIQFGAIGDVGMLSDKQANNEQFTVAGTLPQEISSCFEVLDQLISSPNAIVASMVLAEKNFESKAKIGIIESVLNILSIRDAKAVPMEVKLSELGMDSLMTVEIAHLLIREFNLFLSLQQLRLITLKELLHIKNTENQKFSADNLYK